MNVHSSFIHNNQKLEIAQASVSKNSRPRVEKQHSFTTSGFN